MEELRFYEGKNVVLETINNETYTGYAEDYIFAEDNVPDEVEALVLNYPVRKSDGYKYKNPVEFTANEIKTVMVLDDMKEIEAN